MSKLYQILWRFQLGCNKNFCEILLIPSLVVLTFLLYSSSAPDSVGLQHIAFSPYIAIATVMGGVMSGILATLLSTMLITFILTPTFFSAPYQALQQLIWPDFFLIVTGIITSIMIDLLLRYRDSHHYSKTLNGLKSISVSIMDNPLIRTILGNQFAYAALLDNNGIVLDRHTPQSAATVHPTPGQFFYDDSCWAVDIATRSKLREKFSRARGGSSVQCELDLQLDAGIVPVHFQLLPVRDDNDNTIGFLATGRDISSLKAAEAIGIRHKMILDVTQEGFWLVDAQGILLEVNQAFVDMTGYQVSDLIGQPLEQVSTSEGLQHLWAEISRKLIEGNSVFDMQQSHHDGQEIHLEVSVHFYPNLHQYFVFFRDITARKQQENQLRTTNQLLGLIVDNMPAMIFMKRASDLRFELFNKAGEELLGYKESELLGKNDYDFFPPEEADLFTSEDRAALECLNLTQPPEEKITTRNGDVRYLYTRKVGLRDENGVPQHLLGISCDITEHKKLQESLRFRQFGLDHAGNGVFWIDKNARIIDANTPACVKLGYSHQDLCKMTVADIDPSFPIDGWAEHWQELKLRGSLNFESTHRCVDGTVFPVEITANFFEYEGEEYNCALTRDITERKQVQELRRIAAATFEGHEAIMITDNNGKILRVNQAFQTITGYHATEVIGYTPRILSSGKHEQSFYAGMWQRLQQEGSWEGEIWDKRKNGQVYPKWLTINALRDAEGCVTEYVAIFMDISNIKLAEEEIRTLACYDTLTKLLNRHYLMDELKQALATSAATREYGAVLFLDMDKFKLLNDKFGHSTGDLLLVEVADRLKYCAQDVNTVARFGGDEFVIFFENLGSTAEQANLKCTAYAETIRFSLFQPYNIRGYDYFSSASIGVSLFLGDAVPVDDLLKFANFAMYQAKGAGRNTIYFYDPQAQQKMIARSSLEMDLRLAISDRQLSLYYQVQCDIDHRPVGAEALIRWLHPELGWVSPLQFIPLAEESSLILDIGYWVLNAACAQLAQWSKHPATRHLILAINVSVYQFALPNFVEQVLDVLESHGVEPRRLKLEITESVIMDDFDNVAGKMKALKTHGITVSLDDFGTGYSSLAYLKRLPIDQLKIDKSFVRDIVTDRNDAMMVKTIIELAGNFGIDVIAEGVETHEHLAFLKENGCRHFQGYLFSRPLPVEEFDELVIQGDSIAV